MRLMLATMMCLGMAGCQIMPPPVVVQLPAAADCGAAGLTSYVGQPVASLPAAGAWTSLRVIKPGMMVTMDQNAMRLNARVDASDKIVQLTCG